MVAPSVLRVEHAELAGGSVSFTDDECLTVDVRHEQIVVEQESQTGGISFIYVGEERFEFDLRFAIFFQESLEKLEAIRLLAEKFTLFPFLLEEPGTRFEVFWPEQPTFREQWVRGRRQAQWEIELIWKESRLIECPPFVVTS